MTPQEYIQERLNDQQEWHSKKSGENKRNYLQFQTALIILASLVTLASVFNWEGVNYVTGVLGALIAILTGIVSLQKYQDHWVEYRVVSESLKREYYLYETNCAPYDVDEPFPVLVERVESILATESLNFQERVKREESAAVPVDSGSTDP